MNRQIIFTKKRTPKGLRGSNQYYRIKRVKRAGLKAYMTLALFVACLVYAAIPPVLQWINDTKFQPAYAPELKHAYAESKIAGQLGKVKEATTSAHFSDTREQKVYDYLTIRQSPLAEYSEEIIKEADSNDIPWTLVVAIAGKESTFGKNIKAGSHNAWGIMAWDLKGNRFIRSFASWEAGIKYESALLGKSFRRDMNAGIQARYCPSVECSTSWVKHVTEFQEEINK